MTRPLEASRAKPGRDRVDCPASLGWARIEVVPSVAGLHAQGVRAVGEAVHAMRRAALRQRCAVQAALEVGIAFACAEAERRAARGDGPRRSRRYRGIGGHLIREVADGAACRRLPARQGAGVALEEIAHAQRPGALPLLAVEARELVVLGPEAAGVGRACGRNVRRRLVVEDGVDEVVRRRCRGRPDAGRA